MLGRTMNFADALQGWHDFYVTAGAAAATLVGLLFVGLSLHIKVVVSQPDVRSLARVTLSDFFVILLIALAMLQSSASLTNVAIWMLALTGLGLLLIVRPAVEALRQRGRRTIGLWTLAARFGISVIAFVGLGVCGAQLWMGNYGGAFAGIL